MHHLGNCAAVEGFTCILYLILKEDYFKLPNIIVQTLRWLGGGGAENSIGKLRNFQIKGRSSSTCDFKSLSSMIVLEISFNYCVSAHDYIFIVVQDVHGDPKPLHQSIL